MLQLKRIISVHHSGSFDVLFSILKRDTWIMKKSFFILLYNIELYFYLKFNYWCVCFLPLLC